MTTPSDAQLVLVLVEKDGEHPDDISLGDSITVLLKAGYPVIIGRAPNVDVLVWAPTVGRRVVGIEARPDGVWVRDFGSGGGSSLEVDGVVTERPDCRLPDGALLRIGRVGFRVRLTPSP